MTLNATLRGFAVAVGTVLGAIGMLLLFTPLTTTSPIPTATYASETVNCGMAVLPLKIRNTEQATRCEDKITSRQYIGSTLLGIGATLAVGAVVVTHRREDQ